MSGDGADAETWLNPEAAQTNANHTTAMKGFLNSVRTVVLGTKLNFLLFAIVGAIVFEILEISSATFVFSLLALVPLAERLGFVTEELATYTNDTLGGLLNATFGNATELIICAVSLYNAGKENDPSFLRIVQLSLLGSVLGNLLLVLGTAFLVGGLAHPRQSFNQEGMGVNSGMLLMAVGSILLPSTLSETGTEESKGTSELNLSRFMSVVLLILYALYLIFQLVTHKHLYEQAEEDVEASQPPPQTPQLHPMRSFRSGKSGEEGDYFGGKISELHRARTLLTEEVTETEAAHVHEGMGLIWALVWLGIITVLIAYLSEMVVDTINDAHESLHIPMPFLSTIMLPIVGNAAEHASAILFAYKNKMEITLGVAVGSATQISVLVIPVTVILGWCMKQPLDLDFEWFEAFTLFYSTLVAIIAVNDGTSNWIKGLLLMMTYVFVSASFWVHSDSDLKGSVP